MLAVAIFLFDVWDGYIFTKLVRHNLHIKFVLCMSVVEIMQLRYKKAESCGRLKLQLKALTMKDDGKRKKTP